VLPAGANYPAGPVPAEADAARVEEVTRGIRAVLDVMRQKAPGVRIVLTGILPPVRAFYDTGFYQVVLPQP
jgi:hypothetical protein